MAGRADQVALLHTSETRLQNASDGKLELLPRATLVEARGSLRDVAFAPSEFGMKLVSCPDCIVRRSVRIANEML